MKLPTIQIQGEHRKREEGELMRIAYLANDFGGCTYYRAMLPLDTLWEQKKADVVRVEKGSTPDHIAAAFAGADVIMSPRTCGHEGMLKLIQQFQDDGKVVVGDYDDNIWAVTPLSPHYADYGLANYEHTLPDGRVLKGWVDGTRGFSIARNQERLNAVRAALGKLNLVTTTTPILADVLREINPNVVVLPNCIDMRRWQPLPLKPHDDVRIFWAGGSSHFEDWSLMSAVLPVIVERFPRVKLQIVGFKWDSLLKHVPADRVELYPWEDNYSYPYKCAMLGADISVIPLVDNPFNRCKSPLKFIEQSALGIPSVVSLVSPYAEVYNGSNALMVQDNDLGAWIEAISLLVREPMLRAKIGGEAQRYVRERYDMNMRCTDWLDTYMQAEERLVQEDALCQSAS